MGKSFRLIFVYVWLLPYLDKLSGRSVDARHTTSSQRQLETWDAFFTAFSWDMQLITQLAVHGVRFNAFCKQMHVYPSCSWEVWLQHLLCYFVWILDKKVWQRNILCNEYVYWGGSGITLLFSTTTIWDSLLFWRWKRISYCKVNEMCDVTFSRRRVATDISL